jgi:hypothetical protein
MKGGEILVIGRDRRLLYILSAYTRKEGLSELLQRHKIKC